MITEKLLPIQDRIDEYFKNLAINHSLLKLTLEPKWLEFKLLNRDIEDEEKQHFLVGSAIDTLLTNPDNFNQLFMVWTFKRPPGLMAKFIDALPLNMMLLNQEQKDVAYHEAYIKSGYKKAKASVIDAYETSNAYTAYYYARVQADGKKILSEDDLKQVEAAVVSLHKNPVALQYFKQFNTLSHVEVIPQFPIYFKVNGIEYKGLLDGIVIDHQTKTIELYDLKSVGKSVTRFESYYKEFQYHRQFAFYYYGFKMAMEQMIEYSDLRGYTIMPYFTAIVVPKKDTGVPAIKYIVSQEILFEAFYGPDYIEQPEEINPAFKEPFEQTISILDLMEAYNYHVSTGDYHAPRWIMEQNYTIKID